MMIKHSQGHDQINEDFRAITEDLENLNELVSLQNQVQEFWLQDKLGKQNFDENTKKLFEPFTDTIKNNSEISTKTLSEASKQNNKALENLNNKLLEIMNDRGILATYFMSPLSKIIILKIRVSLN